MRRAASPGGESRREAAGAFAHGAQRERREGEVVGCRGTKRERRVQLMHAAGGVERASVSSQCMAGPWRDARNAEFAGAPPAPLATDKWSPWVGASVPAPPCTFEGGGSAAGGM